MRVQERDMIQYIQFRYQVLTPASIKIIYIVWERWFKLQFRYHTTRFAAYHDKQGSQLRKCYVFSNGGKLKLFYFSRVHTHRLFYRSIHFRLNVTLNIFISRFNDFASYSCAFLPNNPLCFVMYVICYTLREYVVSIKPTFINIRKKLFSLVIY